MVCLHLFCIVWRILHVMLLTAADVGCMFNSHRVTAQVFHRRENLVIYQLGDLFLSSSNRNIIAFSMLYYELDLLN